jgi:aspartate/methionine/tyrosine aminotransferase
MILSDEVYQTNVYKEGATFTSMRHVLSNMGAPYDKAVELVSFNSISKGQMGECGLRGGYFETHNLSPQAEELVFKLKSIELCGNTIGQTGVELMVNPPMLGVESVDTVTKYLNEYSELHGELRRKAKMLTSTFNQMSNVTCTEIEGAMYGFPRVHFSQKFIQEAKDVGKEPDFLYCMDMVNQTGIMTVPGSGFK